ncbi:MAG: hypothetical protein QOG34_403 [Frankiaceae bacterium]|jgi:hypothetical protein|nr:hypothetical protein [Frankiaceae bacterium]
MEITMTLRADARSHMFACGRAATGTIVPSYAALGGSVSVQPKQPVDAGNGGVGALDAWGPPV